MVTFQFLLGKTKSLREKDPINMFSHFLFISIMVIYLCIVNLCPSKIVMSYFPFVSLSFGLASSCNIYIISLV